MPKILNKETAKELMETKGEVRGFSPKAYGQVILEKEGEAGLKKLEDKMAELGYPLKYRKIRAMSFYPLGMELLTLLAIKDVFKYDDKKFEEIGRAQPKFSLIITTFMNFVSVKVVAKQSPGIWKKYYTVGEMKIPEFNGKKRYMVVHLNNFRLHPLHCRILCGYFASVIKMAAKTDVSCQEIKCVFKNDDHHEFLIKW